MNLTFYKYQGTGNDFIIIDNRTEYFPKENSTLINTLCDRHFGIGADGLILLENDSTSDFKMVYFNADGNQSTMCGNGGRCIVAFANKLGLITNKTSFNAIDGLHFATIKNNIVSLQMIDVDKVHVNQKIVFVDTGSPHHVQLVEQLSDFPIQVEGRKIRNEVYGAEGANINFVEQMDDATFMVRTYERGVEDETLACGTGATAVAIAMHKTGKTKQKLVRLSVDGGNLEVSFNVVNEQYKNVFLKGPATFVFNGSIHI
ncbi:MAG: diaminopimelate epimerase [Flavobacteriaceae bacterium]|nr:diaminopimelate epimerase [Flavobacteriaceae bacterium]